MTQLYNCALRFFCPFTWQNNIIFVILPVIIAKSVIIIYETYLLNNK